MAKNKTKQGSALPVVDKSKLARAFSSSVTILRRQWETFYFLFVQDANQRRALETHAPYLTDAAQLAFTVMIYLQIAKLHDPLISMNQPNKRNLVLRRVIDGIAPPISSPERRAIEAAYAQIQPTATKIKQWRNSAGAHQDLLTSLAVTDHLLDPTKPHPLPFIPIRELQAAVAGIVAITDAVMAYQEPGVPWYDAESIRREITQCRLLFMRGTADNHPK